MYYGIITIAVTMFGITFFLNDKYQKESGSGIGATFIFSLINSLAGVFFLLLIHGFKLGTTSFTLIMASLTAINSILYTSCSLKSLKYINLSLYSIFAMLGGMLLPFLVGILFYDEQMTYGKGIALLLIAGALALTLKRDEKKQGTIFYIGIFMLNGMSGVLAKIFQEAPYEKASAASYSIWSALISAVMSAAVLMVIRKGLQRPTKKAVLFTVGYGAINKVANYLLLIALTVLPASVQYPFVTGGTMIASTLISIISHQKPSLKELLSVGLSFAGVTMLMIFS